MNICPICKYDKLEVPAYENINNFSQEELDALSPPYDDTLGKPSYEVCPKCGYEFGNDDNPGTAKPVSFSEYRSEWENEGSKWFDQSRNQPQ